MAKSTKQIEGKKQQTIKEKRQGILGNENKYNTSAESINNIGLK